MNKALRNILFVMIFSSLIMAKTEVWTGWISDVKCGVNVDPACAKKCAAAGEKLVFVNGDKKTVLEIANPDAVKRLAGEHVKVKGTVEKGVLTVTGAEAIKEQAATVKQ